jgi:hypothetical protein
VLGAGVVMLSLWAPPVMTADELAKLRRHTRPRQDVALSQVSADPGP